MSKNHEWSFLGEDTCGDIHWCKNCGIVVRKGPPMEILIPEIRKGHNGSCIAWELYEDDEVVFIKPKLPGE